MAGLSIRGSGAKARVYRARSKGIEFGQWGNGGGGEPTMYPQLAEICHHVAKNTRMAVSITTHGPHLTPELAGRLHGGVHFLRLSMDGIGETYERLRG